MEPGLNGVSHHLPIVEARRCRIPCLFVLILVLGPVHESKSHADSSDPPYAGTVRIHSGIITPSDPTALERISYAGRGQRAMYDRRVAGWISVNAYLFAARFDDRLTTEIQVNPEFGSIESAAAEAEKYGTAIGQLPTVLRTHVDTVWIHKGDHPFGGGINSILIHVDHREAAGGFLEEALAHEAAHASLDRRHGNDPEWLAAQSADDRFISTRARDHSKTEDIAESFLPYLAVRYRSDRISQSYEQTILNTIPHRIAYFDAQSFDDGLHPITAAGRPGTGNRGPVVVGVPKTLDFAFFANGDSVSSDLVLMSVADTLVVPSIYFYGQAGVLIDPESLVDMTDDLTIADDGALTVGPGIPPSSERWISTNGQGMLTIGSMRVTADDPIGGVLRINNSAVGVAGTGSSQPVQDAVFPVRRQVGGINTGAAIRNPGVTPISVGCRLMKQGIVLEEAEILLEGSGHAVRFIDELFRETDSSDFIGSVRCSVPEEKTYAGVALEVDTGNHIFTMLPLLPVEFQPVAPSLRQTLHFAFFANGESFSYDPAWMNVHSDLVLVNLGAEGVVPEIYFHNSQGSRISARLLVDVTGDLEIADDRALTVGTEIPPFGELTISTTGKGQFHYGSVTVVAAGSLGGVLRLNVPDVGVAGMGASMPAREAVFPVRWQENGIASSYVVHSIETETFWIMCDLMQNGVELTGVSHHMSARRLDWRNLHERSGGDTSDFTGSLRCTAPEGKMFTGVVMEMDVDRRIFTALPGVPVR